jgi:hypothetical protein
VDLPSAAEASAWLLEAARAALAAGRPIDLDTVLVLRALAPDDPIVSQAIARLDAQADGGADPAARARHVAAAIRLALDAGDEDRARRLVTDLETELLGVYTPGEGLGSLDADVATASLLLDIWDAGRQVPHQMMAEELVLSALRTHWHEMPAAALPVRAEAARTLGRLYESTGRAEYYDHAVALLLEVGDTYRDSGLAAARFVLALHALP